MADVIKTVHGGHGGKNDFDPGAVSAYGREVDMAREISQLILNRTGAVNTSDSVGTTVNQNLANIAQNINRVANDSDWNLSIHMNSATPSATGVEVFAFGGDPAGMAKASQISKAIANVLGIPDRGAKDGSGLYVIRNTKGHTLLIEVGFVSNANDVAQIRAKKEQVADAIVACFSGGSAPAPKPEQAKETHYPVGSVIVPKDNPKGMSYYVVAVGSLGYVIATKTRWADSSEFSTDRNKVRVGSVVQLKDAKFSYVVVNIRSYSDGRQEFLIAVETRDIAFNAVK